MPVPGVPGAGQACHADHTVEYARGGATVEANLASLCAADHGLRHEGGWTVTQPVPGRLVWHSPLGHTYTKIPPPGPGDALTPMPNPPDHHDQDDNTDEPGYVLSDTCKIRLPSPAPKPPRPTPPVAHEPPPF